MKNIIVLGGNGFVGTVVIEKWLKKDQEAIFYSISRSGKGTLSNSRVKYLKADISSLESIQSIIPDKIDYILDCIGIYDNDKQKLDKFNLIPAKVMLEVAEQIPVKCLGYIGGAFGSKVFVKSKTDVVHMLQSSGKNIVVVEPSLIYGNGRSDSMIKMVPFMKVIGIFSKKLRPIDVNDLASELIEKMTSNRTRNFI